VGRGSDQIAGVDSLRSAATGRRTYQIQAYDSLTCMYDCPVQHAHMNYRFTGKERDGESGNDYFGARYYASTMGRFMSPDYSSDEDGPQPVPYANLEDPQGLNQYAYAGNNPLTFTDPDGHFPCPGGNGQDVACAVQAAVNWIKNLFSGGGGGGCTGTCVSDAPSGPPSNNPNFTPQLQTRTTTASNNSFRNSLPQFLGGPDACTQMDCSKLQIQQDIMPWGMVGGLGGASGLFSGAERNALNGVLKGIANGTNKGVEFENFAAKASGWAKPLPAQAAGYYRRYVVSLGAGKGAFRLVTGLGGEMYATFDHYVSWIKIR
jgi:RHS repeat-associated protein